MMIKKLTFLASAVLLLMLAGCVARTEEMGILEGKVTIGPLVPVEQPGVTPTVPPEVYAARKIIVYDGNGKKLLREVNINSQGNYKVELVPGDYVIDINYTGIDHSGDVPKKLEIIAGQTVNLDIDIDTGIR